MDTTGNRPKKSLQPTPDGELSFAFAGHAIGPAWLSSVVRRQRASDLGYEKTKDAHRNDGQK